MAYSGEYHLNHKWVESLKVFKTNKIRVCDESSIKKDGNIQKLLSLGTEKYIPFPKCLITYLGFGFNPSGLFFRSLEEKSFHCKEFSKRSLLYYVAENFEKNINDFKFGDTIVLLEGPLDVESFSYLTGHSFVIGYMTSYVRPTLAALLSTLTDKFLMIPDNDQNERIEKSTRESVKNLQKFGVTPSIMRTESSDFGDVFYTKNQSDVNKAIFNLKN